MERKRRAIRGGGLVAINHTMTAAVTVLSALLMSKVLGPQTFAIYALCTSLSAVLRPISRLGINACLLTQTEEPSDHDYATALLAMMVCSLVVALAAITAVPLLKHFSRIPDILAPAILTISLIPLHVISLPALTKLERGLNYKPAVVIELSGQILAQVFGIALAYRGWGIFGPLTGWGVRSVFQAIVPWVVIRQVPRVSWDWENAKRMVKYGFGFVAATSLVHSRDLIFLSVVGRVLGQESVGQLGLALRATGLIGAFRAAAARVVLPALSPIAHLPAALRNGLIAVVETELLLSVPVTAVAVSVYPICTQMLLGSAWQPSIALFPWLAAGSLLAATHATSLSALHLRGYFTESIVSTGMCVFALATFSALLGSYWGLEGCAAATVVLWPMYWIQEWFSFKRLGTVLVLRGMVWAVGGAAACLSWRLGPGLMVVTALVVMATSAGIKSRFMQVRSAIRSKKTRAQTIQEQAGDATLEVGKET